MAASPSFHNVSGTVFYVDTNVIDDTSSPAVLLRDFWSTGWISLMRTDVMDTELDGAKDPALWAALTEESARYPESLGAWVLGHSRLDSTILGGASDEELHAEIFAVLKPGVDRWNCRSNHTRDVMHVATAMRYGAKRFVTNDAQMLKRSHEVAAQFAGFQILNPPQAAREAVGAVKGMLSLQLSDPTRHSLPPWPSLEELPALESRIEGD
ncbi:hypothetical protein [Streptomyces parvus]|uniref:hypothetical protein n=1 Tax=Streptomyces parvus TaxID=66428 RepID=UPI00210107EF|nr:hypothetical protein [Streptomyces parvus]MCQ1575348.1 hypothetical protein [Streptomyces parvus]